jgi:hypothetical protein
VLDALARSSLAPPPRSLGPYRLFSCGGAPPWGARLPIDLAGPAASTNYAPADGRPPRLRVMPPSLTEHSLVAHWLLVCHLSCRCGCAPGNNHGFACMITHGCQFATMHPMLALAGAQPQALCLATSGWATQWGCFELRHA